MDYEPVNPADPYGGKWDAPSIHSEFDPLQWETVVPHKQQPEAESVHKTHELIVDGSKSVPDDLRDVRFEDTCNRRISNSSINSYVRVVPDDSGNISLSYNNRRGRRHISMTTTVTVEPETNTSQPPSFEQRGKQRVDSGVVIDTSSPHLSALHELRDEQRGNSGGVLDTSSSPLTTLREPRDEQRVDSGVVLDTSSHHLSALCELETTIEDDSHPIPNVPPVETTSPPPSTSLEAKVGGDVHIVETIESSPAIFQEKFDPRTKLRDDSHVVVGEDYAGSLISDDDGAYLNR